MTFSTRISMHIPMEACIKRETRRVSTAAYERTQARAAVPRRVEDNGPRVINEHPSVQPSNFNCKFFFCVLFFQPLFSYERPRPALFSVPVSPVYRIILFVPYFWAVSRFSTQLLFLIRFRCLLSVHYADKLWIQRNSSWCSLVSRHVSIIPEGVCIWRVKMRKRVQNSETTPRKRLEKNNSWKNPNDMNCAGKISMQLFFRWFFLLTVKC